jgi:glycine cleavage system pyridoxal-binding protein P
LVVTGTIDRFGIAVGFGAGLVATVAVQMVSLRAVRRPIPMAVTAP